LGTGVNRDEQTVRLQIRYKIETQEFHSVKTTASSLKRLMFEYSANAFEIIFPATREVHSHQTPAKAHSKSVHKKTPFFYGAFKKYGAQRGTRNRKSLFPKPHS